MTLFTGADNEALLVLPVFFEPLRAGEYGCADRALVLIGAARADTLKEFVVSGTAENESGGSLGSCAAEATCSVSGTMMVDVTSSAAFPRGFVTAYDITFPGLAPTKFCF